MIEYLRSLFFTDPVFFIILVGSILATFYLTLKIFYGLFEKRGLKRVLIVFFEKKKLRSEVGKIRSIEELYKRIMNIYIKKGVIDGFGYKSRKKLLEISEGNLKNFFKKVFSLYEKKKYGKKGIENEKKLVSDLLFEFFSLQ